MILVCQKDCVRLSLAVNMRDDFSGRQGLYSGDWMKDSTELRLRLESSQYPDLGAMMEGYARAAAEMGRSDFQ